MISSPRRAFSLRASTERSRNRSSSYSFRLPLEAQQKPIVAESRHVHHLLIDQHGIDHAADFHQLLPLAAVARKAGDSAGGHRTHLAQTDFGDHALETGTRPGPCSGSSQVLIHHLISPIPVVAAAPPSRTATSGSPGYGSPDRA